MLAENGSDEVQKNDKRARKHEFRRKSILMAARQLFIEEDFGNLRIEAIAEAAAISKATLYQYFTGKGEIFDAVLLADVEELIAGLEANWSPTSNFATNIRRMTYFYVSFFVRHQEYFANMSFFFLPGRREPLPPGTRDQVRGLMARGIDTIAAAMESAQQKGEIRVADAKLAATSVWCLWEGAAWAYATGRCEYYDRDVYDVSIRGVDLFAAGLRVNRGEAEGTSTEADTIGTQT
jgi:AcrR family transcriptional regulator